MTRLFNNVKTAALLAGMFALRKSLQRSLIRTSPAPHAGLGLEHYTQATSPLRRYVDLLVHQQLRAHLRGETLRAPKRRPVEDIIAWETWPQT